MERELLLLLLRERAGVGEVACSLYPAAAAVVVVLLVEVFVINKAWFEFESREFVTSLFDF